MKYDLIDLALKISKQTQLIKRNIDGIEKFFANKQKKEQKKEEVQWSVDRLSKSIKKGAITFSRKVIRKDVDMDHPMVKQVSERVGEYLGLGAGTAFSLIKAGAQLQPIMNQYINNPAGYQALATTETGITATAETLGVLAGEEAAVGGIAITETGLATAGTIATTLEAGTLTEVAASIIAPEIMIPAIGIGLAIKELYQLGSDIF